MVDGPGDAAPGQVHDGARYDFGKSFCLMCFSINIFCLLIVFFILCSF